MTDRLEIAKALDNILLPYAQCISWKHFGAAGSPCYDPNDFASSAEREEAASPLAAVQLKRKKKGARHTKLAKKVATQTGDEYVTYPWLRDAVSRILTATTYDDLLSMAKLSRAVKDGMKAKGLTEVHSIHEAL